MPHSPNHVTRHAWCAQQVTQFWELDKIPKAPTAWLPDTSMGWGHLQLGSKKLFDPQMRPPHPHAQRSWELSAPQVPLHWGPRNVKCTSADRPSPSPSPAALACLKSHAAHTRFPIPRYPPLLVSGTCLKPMRAVGDGRNSSVPTCALNIIQGQCMRQPGFGPRVSPSPIPTIG